METKPSSWTGASKSATTLPKKRMQDTGHSSDSEAEASAIDSLPSVKKQKNKGVPEPQENKDKEVYYDLGGKRRITLRDFKGKSYVDIREFYGDDADLKPGKKGIMLSLESAAVLRDVLNGLDSLTKS